MLKKTTLAAAVAVGLGSTAAQSAVFDMTFMDFPGAQNDGVVGTFNSTAGTGAMGSGPSGTNTLGPNGFFGHAWTGTFVAGFETAGAGSWTYSTAGGSGFGTGTYNFTLAAGQVGMGILFDWNGNVGIPVFNIMNADGSGFDIDGDGTIGTKMATAPFLNSPVGFSGSLVPVPAAVWLFGSGLVGLAGIARRRKAS